MFCEYCGVEQKNADDRFCSECGKPYSVAQHEGKQGTVQNVITEPVGAAGAQPELKKISLLKVILFSCITLWFYPPLWFIRRKDSFNRLVSTKKIGSGLPVLIIVFFALALIAAITAMVLAETKISVSEGLTALSYLFDIAGSIILIILSFRGRRILIDHFNGHLQRGVPFSGVATFFFNIFYLQYKINRL
ncbi:MAG TPA: hypothetical protein VN328_10900 [Thermodesulfovibrionales bacterium]|nr:hypothetical protein [Thermodesulfovibrionales bacterium]